MLLKNKKCFLNYCLLLILLLILFSCPQKYDSESDSGSDNGGDIKNDDYVIKTAWGVDDEGRIQFYTNDSQYIDNDGHNFWKWGNYYENDTDKIIMQVTITKESGDPEYGSGVIFCLQDDVDTQKFLTVLINSKSNYKIGKVEIDKNLKISTFTDILPQQADVWGNSTNLITSEHGATNTINVSYDTNVNAFRVTFNNNNNPPEDITFQENDLLTGCYGHLVTISPDENFPQEPVFVKFKQLAPVDIQLPSKSFNIKSPANFQTYDIEGVLYK